MAAYHFCIGHPWILDVLSKYGQGIVKQKSVLAQVVEFVKMPKLSAEGSQYPEAVVHLSDQKYYIRAVLTREAQETLEREDEHFTVADIKNKLIILKTFSVCFTAVEELKNCEFYLRVEHVSVMAMETNAVDLLNCNMEPGVRKKIKELWQNYMKEIEMRETSVLNLSDVSLTQLLMVESEEKFRALKSIAENCLDLNPFDTQEIPAQARTNWGNKKIANTFSVPIHLLLIPPHEESALEQMTEFRNDIHLTSDVGASSDRIHSSQPYSIATSTVSEEPMDDGPSSQSGNPWNQLQPLCISVATCSDSQPGISRPVAQRNGEEDLVASPDSSTPDIFMSHLDVSAIDFTESQNEISSLTFSETCKNPQPPEPKIPAQTAQSNDSSSNSGLCSKSRLSDTNQASLIMIPLTQDSQSDCSNRISSSPQSSFTMGSKAQICPVLSHSSQSENRSRIKIEHILPNHDSNLEMYSLRRRKVLKRKHSSDDSESTLSDLEQQIPICVDWTNCVTTVTDTDNQVQTARDKQLEDRHRTGPISNLEEEQVVTMAGAGSPRICGKITAKKCVMSSKPSLEFVVKQKVLATKGSESILSSAERPTTSRAKPKEASSIATFGQSSTSQGKEKSTVTVIERRRNKMTHNDGTPFQYKYKPPTADLCARVNSIRMPADLCEWALKILSDHEEKVP